MADAINRSITVSVSNQTSDPTVDEPRLREAVTHVLESNSIGSAAIGVAVVSDEKIRLLNREFLQQPSIYLIKEEHKVDVSQCIWERTSGQSKRLV